MALLDDIKAVAKDGADLTAIEQGLSGLNPLSTINDKDGAWDLIKSNQYMLSAFDSKQSERAKTVEENLMSGKVQELIKTREEELRQELNPDEDPSAKVARDFEDYKKQVEQEKATAALKDELSSKAKELDFDAMKARDYAVYGDKAVEKLEADAKWFSSQLESRINDRVKEKFGDFRPPKKTNIEPATLDQKIMEARAAGRADEALKLQMMKQQV